MPVIGHYAKPADQAMDLKQGFCGRGLKIVPIIFDKRGFERGKRIGRTRYMTHKSVCTSKNKNRIRMFPCKEQFHPIVNGTLRGPKSSQARSEMTRDPKELHNFLNSFITPTRDLHIVTINQQHQRQCNFVTILYESSHRNRSGIARAAL